MRPSGHHGSQGSHLGGGTPPPRHPTRKPVLPTVRAFISQRSSPPANAYVTSSYGARQTPPTRMPDVDVNCSRPPWPITEPWNLPDFFPVDVASYDSSSETWVSDSESKPFSEYEPNSELIDEVMIPNPGAWGWEGVVSPEDEAWWEECFWEWLQEYCGIDMGSIGPWMPGMGLPAPPSGGGGGGWGLDLGFGGGGGGGPGMGMGGGPGGMGPGGMGGGPGGMWGGGGEEGGSEGEGEEGEGEEGGSEGEGEEGEGEEGEGDFGWDGWPGAW